jgi:hypothetical protein
MFSITTIASSTTSPVASVTPNSVSVLIENPNSFDERECPDERHRNGDRGDERGPPVLQEQEHHQDDQTQRLDQRRDHLADRFGHDAGGVEGDRDFEPWWKAFGQALELRVDVAIDLQRVRRRQLQDAEADRVAAVVARRQAVRFGAELGTADVLHANQRAVLGAFEDDVVEFRRLGQPAFRADTDLEAVALGRGLGSHRAGRDLRVLLAQRLHHFVGRHVARGQPIGVEPQPHRVSPDAEHDHVAYAGDALDFVDDEAVHVVADEHRVVLVVFRVGRGGEDEIGRDLRDRDADLLDLVRQAPFGLGNAVLHVDRRDVEIARQIERDDDRGRTRRCRWSRSCTASPRCR